MFHSRFKIPLHLWIIIPFVLQVVGIVGLVGYFSYRSGEKSVQQLVDRLAIVLNGKVEVHLNNYLNRAQEVNQMNVKALESGTIDLNDFEKLGQYFYHQVKQFEFDYVNFGTKDGHFIGSGYISPTTLAITETVPGIPRYTRSYGVNDQGERLELLSENYNASSNYSAWYQDAIGTSEPIWSSIYTWGNLPENASISASHTVHDAEGNFLGVLGIDLSLDRINSFLKTVSQSNAVEVFIIERSGLLVASSQENPIRLTGAGTTTRIQAINHEDPRIQQITHLLIDRFQGLGNITSSQLLRPPVQEGKILTSPFVKVTPFQDTYGLDWLVITIIPEAQFTAEIRSNQRRTMGLCGLAFVSPIGFGIWTARRISRSLIQLHEATQSLADSNFETQFPESYISEVDRLYHSFGNMAKSLEKAHQLQENYQSRLHQEVRIKTAALNEAQAIAQMGSWEFDVITKTTKWSEELYQIYEVENLDAEEELRGEVNSTMQCIYPGDQDKYQREIIAAVTQNQPFDCDIRIVTQKGNLRYIQAKGRPLFDQQGNPVRYVGTVADISDRKKLEIALQDSQKKLSEVLDTAIVGIIRLRFYDNGRIEYDYISPHCEKIFGFAVTALKANPDLWRSKIHPEDWKNIVLPCMDALHQCKNNFYMDTIEYRFYRPDDTVVWILGNCFCLWNESGNYWNVTVVDTDISDRKQLELKLRSSEAKLNSILNSVSAIITHLWIYPDNQWEIDYVSAGAETISGYTQRELQDPFLWINRIVPEDWQKLESKVFEDVFAQRSATYEYRFRRKDEQISWVSQHNYSSWDEIKKAWSLTIITMDISDRKQEETKRRDSEETLAEAQHIAHIGNWSFDWNTQKIHWSEELFRMFGLDPTQPEPTYEQYLALVDPTDRLELQEKVKLAITKGIPYLIDYKAILPDGSIRFHEGRGEAKRDDQGQIIGLKGTGLDITERKLVELELIERTEELDRFFSVALDLLCIATAEGYFLRVNPQWEKTLGYPLAEFKGSRFLDYVHPDDLPITLASIEHLIQEKVLSSFLNRYRCAQGEYRWLEWRSVMVGDRIYAAARDITQQKQVQEHLENAKNRAEALTLAKTEFVANMSHEIRTPLSSIITIAELLENTSLSLEQQDLVKTLSYSSHTLMDIVNDILDFSKIESGNLSLEKIPFSIQTEIDSIFSIFEQSIQAKNLTLKSSVPVDLPPTFLGDSARFRQILLNLVSNAIKFTETGSIWVIVRANYRETLDTNPPYDRYELRFSIQDTGIGIQPQQLEKLFRPFSQGDTSINRKYGGTGLGLVISQRLVELMGGYLWVESLGRIAGTYPEGWHPTLDTTHLPGSTFYFTIVLESPRPLLISNDQNGQAAAHPLEPLNQTFSQHYPLTILLADDNPINRKVVQVSFRKLGYWIDTVNNGKEALEAVESKEYDLVLMDMQMPEMDGLTATQMIRKMPLKQPWIIALTANVLPQDRQACFDAGMNGYETKPLNLGKIQQICQEMVKIPKPHNLPDRN